MVNILQCVITECLLSRFAPAVIFWTYSCKSLCLYLCILNHLINFYLLQYQQRILKQNIDSNFFFFFSFSAYTVIEYFFKLHPVDLIGRLKHELAAFNQPLIFFKVLSPAILVTSVTCTLPRGKALFRKDIRLFLKQ